MKIPCIIVFLFGINQVYTQNYSSQNPDYISLVQAGEKAMNSEKYDSCLFYYDKAFEIKQTSYFSTLRAATCAYNMGDESTLDRHLTKAFDLDWGGTRSLFYNMEEFHYLLETPFEEMIKERWEKAAVASGADLKLMEELAEIRRTDQEHRMKMRDVSEKYGWQSPQMDSLWTLQNAVDSVNQSRIIEIIDEYGYPGQSLVGGESSTAFLVIQHADLDIQEKYLPIITDAADAGEVAWSSVALLVDRVKMRQGGKQIYGSQVLRDEESGEHYFAPIEKPFKIDSIRATVGLPAIQSYGNNWDIKWDPQKHIDRQKKE